MHGQKNIKNLMAYAIKGLSYMTKIASNVVFVIPCFINRINKYKWHHWLILHLGNHTVLKLIYYTYLDVVLIFEILQFFGESHK